MEDLLAAARKEEKDEEEEEDEGEEGDEYGSQDLEDNSNVSKKILVSYILFLFLKFPYIYISIYQNPTFLSPSIFLSQENKKKKLNTLPQSHIIPS